MAARGGAGTRITVSWYSPVSKLVCPPGPMTALIPVTAAWTMVRPDSTARSCPAARCWRGPAPVPNEALLVMISSTWAPSRVSWRASPVGRLPADQGRPDPDPVDQQRLQPLARDLVVGDAFAGGRDQPAEHAPEGNELTEGDQPALLVVVGELALGGEQQALGGPVGLVEPGGRPEQDRRPGRARRPGDVGLALGAGQGRRRPPLAPDDQVGRVAGGEGDRLGAAHVVGEDPLGGQALGEPVAAAQPGLDHDHVQGGS